MRKTIVEKVSEWVTGSYTADIPANSVTLIKHSLLDAIGCAYVTLDEDCVGGILKVARTTAGEGRATVIGCGYKATPGTAVLANGSLIRAIDWNDHLAIDPVDGTKLGGHPSDNFAPILAVAEQLDRSGKEVLAASLAGYELYGRTYRFLTPDLPWDHTTAFGLSVPAVCAKLMGLSVRQTANAIAISAAQCATLAVVRRGQLSHSKFLAGPLVAHRGLLAAELAAAGTTGPMTVFEDPRGVNAGVFQRTEGIELLYASNRPKEMVEGVTIKAFPGMDTSQAAAEAACKAAANLTSDGRLRADDIATIELIMNDHPSTKLQAYENEAERRQPETRETADHSLYYIVAVSLLDGEMTPRQFHDNRWLKPDVHDLMNRIVIKTNPEWTHRAPGGFPCTVALKTRDGRESVAEVGFATGHAHNRMTRDQVVAKFMRNVQGKVTPARANEIVAAVDALDSLGSIRELTCLLG